MTPGDTRARASMPMRALKGVGLVSLVLLGVVLGVVGVAHTDFGRARILAAIVHQADAAVAGRLRVARLEGSLLGSFSLHGLSLGDGRGRPALSIDRLELDLHPWSLLSGVVHLERVSLVGVRLRLVRGADGDFDLMRLVAPTRPVTPEAERSQSSWRVRIDRLELSRGAISYRPANGDPLRVDGIRLRAGGSWSAGWTRAHIDALRFSPQQGPGPIEVSGRLLWAGRWMAVRQVSVEAGRSAARSALALFDLERLALVAGLRLELRAADAGRLRPAWLRPGADLAAQGALWRMGRDAGWHLGLSGRLARAAIHLDAETVADGGRVEIRADDLRPAALLDLADQGAALPERAIDSLRVEAELHAGRLAGDFRAVGSGTELRGRAQLDLASGLRSVRANLDAEVSDLARLLGVAAPLGGDLSLHARVDGRPSGLQTSGSLRSDCLRLGTNRSRALDGDFDLRWVPGRLPSGRAGLTAGRVILAGRVLHGVDLELRRGAEENRLRAKIRIGRKSDPARLAAVAWIRRDAQGTRAELDSVALHLLDSTWRGAATARFGPRGRLRLDGLALSSADASVSLRGGMGGGRPARATLAVQGLDLGRLARVLRRRVVGAGRLDLALRLRGALASPDLAASVRVRGLESAHLNTPVDATLDVEWMRGRLALSASARPVGQDRGRIRLVGTGRTPVRPWEPAGWRRMTPAALQAARLSVEGVALAPIRERLERLGLLPAHTALAGRLDAAVDWFGTERGLGLRVVGRDLQSFLSPSGQGQAGLTAKVSPDATRVELIVEDGLGGRSKLEGRIGAGLEALLGARWSDFSGAEVEATGRLDGLDLNPLGPLIGLDSPLGGRARGRSTLSGSMAEPRIEGQLDVSDLRLGAMGLPAVHLEAEHGPDGSAAEARIEVSPDNRLSATLHWTRGEDHLRVGLQAEALDLQPFGPWLRAVGVGLDSLGGTLRADLRADLAAGALGDLRGDLEVADGRLSLASALTLDDMSLQARALGDRIEVNLDGLYGPGVLSAEASLALGARLPEHVDGRLELTRFPVPGLMDRASASGTIALVGDRSASGWRLEAGLERGRVRLLDRGGGDLHGTGALEDVVYVDRLAADRRDGRPGPASTPDGEPAAPAARSPVHLSVVTRDALEVRGHGVRTSVTADLEVRAGAGSAVVRGKAEAGHGRVDVFDRRYEIRRAVLAFDGRSPPNPQVDVLLAHQFPETTVTIGLTGSPDKPRLQLGSDPPGYSQAELLSFVLGGRPGARAPAEGGLGDAALGLASSLVTQQIQKLVRGSLPVDTIRVGTGQDDAATVDNVTVGKWVTDSLFLAYRRNLQADEDESANQARLEYWFASDWMLEGQIGDRGQGGLDLMWILRF